MGFSAEMKDFLLAYKTGQSINASRTNQDYIETRGQAVKEKAARDNDPETIQLAKDKARATLAATKQRMSLGSAASGRAATLLDDRLKSSALRRQLLQVQLDQLNNPGGIGLGSDGYAPSPGQGALPSVELNTGADEYAEGGLVDDEDDGLDEPSGVLDTSEEEEPAPMQMAVLAPPAAPAYPQGAVGAIPTAPQAPVATQAASRNRGIEGVIAPALVEDARKQGMKFGIEKAGLHQSGAIRSPAALLKAKQIAAGMGGLSEPEMQAARQAVDPEGKLTDSQRNVAALGSVYQFYANKGQPEKAQKVAFQMLQYYRGASQRYAALAAKAAEGGNMDLATKAALKAYANVPDGRDLELSPNPDGGLLYSYTDEKGNVIDKGVATPQQLVASAMGLATGGFDKALLAAAGATPDAGAVKTGGKPQSASDRAKETESIVGEVDKMKNAWAEKNKGTAPNEEQWAEIGNIAQHIYQQNPHSTPNEVAHAAHAMLSMGADPEKPGFKIKPGEEGAPNVVDFGGGRTIKLDEDNLQSILNARAMKVKAATDKINADMEASEKPGFIAKATPAVSDIGAIIAAEANDIPEPIRRGASAVGHRVMDAVGAIADSDAKINVGTLTTAAKNKILQAAQAIKGLGSVGKNPDDKLEYDEETK